MPRFPLLVGGLLLGTLLAVALLAAAHERVCIHQDGTWVDKEHANCPSTDKYQFLIGWVSEPPVTGVFNGLDLGITRPAANGTNVESVTTLQAEWVFGGQTHPSELRGQFGRPGRYRDDIIPTRPGIYTIHVWGTVEGTAVNFTKSPEEVTAATDLQFPAAPAAPDANALQARITALEQQVSDLKAQVQGLKANATANRSSVSPTGTATPGFEAAGAVVALGALGVALASRKR